jgi:hypothetical protein
MKLWGLAAMVALGCNGGTDDGVDSGPNDSGPPPDSGVRATCPMLEAPQCMNAAGCGEVIPKGECTECYDYSHALCTFGACETPELLAASNPVRVFFTVEGALAPRVSGFVRAAIAAETSGGASVSCTEVYAGEVDLTRDCYNIVDSSRFSVAMVGDTYQVFFSGLPTERKVLLLLWGYETTEPIGLSCTEFDVGGRDGTGVDVEGDMMRLIQ